MRITGGGRKGGGNFALIHAQNVDSGVSLAVDDALRKSATVSNKVSGRGLSDPVVNFF